MALGSVDFKKYATWTVGSSQRTDNITLNGDAPVALIQPSSVLVSTTITFEVAPTSTSTFYALVTSSGGAYTLNTSTQLGQVYALDYTRFLGVEVVKAVMASSQDGTKTMTLVVRPFS